MPHYAAVRKFNGAVDQHWSTPEGIEEWGGYATFDHHLGGGTFEDAIQAIHSFMSEQSKPGDKFKWGSGWKLAKERGEYNAIMRELNNPTPREFSFVFNQDVFEVSISQDPRTGVRNFKDPRLDGDDVVDFEGTRVKNTSAGDWHFENGRIVRNSDGAVRHGWRWVKR